MFCLPKLEATKFIEALKTGKIDPGKLSQLSSKERRDFFSEIVGKEDAVQVNSLFESKLLLKNQQQGMITWAKQLTGIKEPIKRDILSKIERLDKVLSADEEQAFLEDLASKRLGAEVTFEEAQKIASLSKEAASAKEQIPEDAPPGSPERMAYGRPLVRLQNYVNDLKLETQKITLEDIKKNPGANTLRAVSNLGGLTKSIKASLDNSVIGRQGLKVLFTNPSVWAKNSLKSFQDIVQSFGGKEVLDEVKAEVLSRPNALNGLYDKEKLAVGVVEEAYPTSLPERVPVAGRAFKASQAAFTAFQYRTRADVFDRYVEIADKTGADLKGIGKVANSLTGRGTFGARGENIATHLNNVFFSPRFLKSNIDLLTAHYLDSGISPFARRQAALNLLKVVGGVASVLAIAKAVNPDSVDFDPRSANFGKIRVGNTRFEVSGGMASIITLASRLITQNTKSSTSNKVTPLNTGKYGAPTGTDVLTSFFENKFSPLASALNDYAIRGRDFKGDKPTLGSTAKNLLAPLPYTNYEELRDNPNSAPILAAMIADALGFGTNTY